MRSRVNYCVINSITNVIERIKISDELDESYYYSVVLFIEFSFEFVFDC